MSNIRGITMVPPPPPVTTTTQSQYYDESEQPIYHQADQNEQNLKQRSGLGVDHNSIYGHGNCLCNSSRECNKHVEAHQSQQIPSMKRFIGIQDVCGNKWLLRMLGAEFVGTMLLVFIGCGGWIATGHDYLMTAFAFGIAVATIAQALGHVSGAHLNPAVSLGLVAAGECSLLKAVVYIVAQCLGAIVGAAMLRMAIPEIPEKILNEANKLGRKFEARHDNLCLTLLANNHNSSDPSQWNVVSPMHGVLIEAVITFVLVLTVCGVCDSLRKDVKGSAPLAIGLSIFVCHIMAINYTGASMNPARSLGPALVSTGDYKLRNHWGPILGGVTAGFLYQLAFKERPSSAEEGRPNAVNNRRNPS